MRTRNNTKADFTDLVIVGNPDQITALINLARRSGLLAYASAPASMGEGDPRHRRFLRLRNRTR